MSNHEDSGRRMSSRTKRQRSYDDETEESIAPAKQVAKPASVQKQHSTSVSPHERGAGSDNPNRAKLNGVMAGGSSSDGASSGSRGMSSMHESMIDFGALGLRIRSASEDASALEAQLGRAPTAGEKQELRKQRNRESAALSRQRSKTYTKALEEKIMELQGRVAELEGELERYVDNGAESQEAVGGRGASAGQHDNGSAATGQGNAARRGNDGAAEGLEYAVSRTNSARVSSYAAQDRAAAPYHAAAGHAYAPDAPASAPHQGSGSTSGGYGEHKHGLSSALSGGSGFYPPTVGLVRSESYPLSSSSAYSNKHGTPSSALYAGQQATGMPSSAGPALGLGLARTQSFHPGDLPPASAFSTGGTALLPPSISSLAPPGRGSSHKKGSGSAAPSRTGSYGSTGYVGGEEEGGSSAERGRSRVDGPGGGGTVQGGAPHYDEQGLNTHVERMSVVSSSREGSRDREREQERAHSSATSRTRHGSEDMRGSTGTGSSSSDARSMYAGASSGSVDWSATAIGGMNGAASRNHERPVRTGGPEGGLAGQQGGAAATAHQALRMRAGKDGRVTPDNNHCKASDSESSGAGPLASPARSTASGVERDRDVAALLASGLR